MSAPTGLDSLIDSGFDSLKGKNVGLVCNQATVDHHYHHVLEHFLRCHNEGQLRLKAVFGPQHGLFGHTQDNMIEWEAAPTSRFPFAIHSLYGEHREPTDAMLEGIDLLVVDLPDVGSRYYTFIWTTALCLKACERLGIPMLLLDRPNPLGGVKVEGPVLDPEYASFVGLFPLPLRHGMTLGEVALYLKATQFPKVAVEIVKFSGWERKQYLDETKAPWAMPSPNLPTLDSAIVYPGGCLLEGTTLSEGRGTTRPFEIFGAPYIDAWDLCQALNAEGLPGIYFRPYQFEPTFQKHAGVICEGAFVHVTDRHSFEPVTAYIAVLREIAHRHPNGFAWKAPPYEYEYVKLPIDILAGNTWVREMVESGAPLSQISDRSKAEAEQFEETRKEFLLY